MYSTSSLQGVWHHIHGCLHQICQCKVQFDQYVTTNIRVLFPYMVSLYNAVATSLFTSHIKVATRNCSPVAISCGSVQLPVRVKSCNWTLKHYWWRTRQHQDLWHWETIASLKSRASTSVWVAPLATTMPAHTATGWWGMTPQMEYDHGVFKDHHKISIQEMLECAPPDQLPHSTDITLDGFVDMSKPGDRVQLVSLYRSVGGAQLVYSCKPSLFFTNVLSVTCSMRFLILANSSNFPSLILVSGI